MDNNVPCFLKKNEKVQDTDRVINLTILCLIVLFPSVEIIYYKNVHVSLEVFFLLLGVFGFRIYVKMCFLLFNTTALFYFSKPDHHRFTPCQFSRIYPF